MPPQQGVWLNKQEGLLPGSNPLGQQDEERSIGPGASGSFHLSTENDELLAQESVFSDELGLASAKVRECCERQGGSERFRPAKKARVKHV